MKHCRVQSFACQMQHYIDSVFASRHTMYIVQYMTFGIRYVVYTQSLLCGGSFMTHIPA